MSVLIDQAAKLLDFSQKLDIHLLDSVISCMYTGAGQQVRTKYTYYCNNCYQFMLVLEITGSFFFLVVNFSRFRYIYIAEF